ncbi:Two pore calcium channel protein 1 [Phytophthora pseudosyringae]|uniref:Two pore calcium channel protein 1 n=1 Tax=Phytophthora pseudosyringae TaxID=221518 RepID=A0A8T1W1C4_9STRA|nr:Two pore calcium channel protein 1 [Phytophthora pseudosyringae]
MERPALHAAAPAGSYGAISPPREGLLHHLASQDTHVESLQTLSRKLERNTFAPVVCSILGVVVFMRLGVVVGTLGIYYALVVISSTFAITFLTVMSMSALASTGDGVALAGGGLFNALRRSLGHRLGHMIGLMMYLSFGIGAAFYLLGFSELAMVVVGVQDVKGYTLPWNENASAITLATASVILALLMFGVQVRITLRALRLVFVTVMVALGCNVLFLSVTNVSKHTGMSMKHFRQNSEEHMPKMFRQMFATFFPGFCGVIAGANLAEFVSERTAARASSAVARKASQYFLLGIHKALAFSFVIYVGLAFVLAACVENKVLETEPFVVPLVVDSALGVPLIFLGVASTTLSSALSNVKGASTIFAALYAQPTPSDEGSSHSKETEVKVSTTEMSKGQSSTSTSRKGSIFALACTWVVCQAALLCGTVDAIIPIVSSTFLLTFFLLNFACFFQDLSSTTFHPSFRMYSKWTAFLGCLLSLSAFFLVVSTLFVSVSSVLLLSYTAFYHHELTQFVDELRVSQHSGRRRLHRQDAVDEQILAEETRTPLGMLGSGISRRRGSQQVVDSKRVELAALYIRDAIHGRFLGEEYLIDGLNRMHYKQLFHGLWYVRTANMCVLMALAFFETPSWCFYESSCGDLSKVLTWELPVLPEKVSIAIELVCLLFLALELSMKYKYMGSRVYFVDKWHILQIVFLLADFVAVLTVLVAPQDTDLELYHSGNSRKNEPGLTESKPSVLAPLIRPFIVITMSHRLRSGFSSLLKALPRFADGLITLVFLIVLYAVLGMVLFVGSAEAESYFKSFEDACLSLIILLTTANFPDVMMPIYSQARVYSIFFISFLMIGQLLVMNLVFASIYQHYRQEIAERAMDYSTKRKLALQAAFHLLPTEQVIFPEDATEEDAQFKTVSRRTYNRLVNKLMRPTLSLFHDDEASPSEDSLSNLESSNEPITFEEFVVLIKAFIAREKSSAQIVREPRQPSNYAIIRGVQCFVERGWFDNAVDVIILGNLVAILVEIQSKNHGDVAVSLSWERWMPVFSIVYIIEMLLKIYAFHSSGYFSSAKNIYDCTVTLVIFVAEVGVHSHSLEVEWQWIRLLLLFRFLRCLRLLVALQALSSMFAIVVRLIPAFVTLYGMLGVLMYEYAAVGMQLFGGKLVVGDPRLAAITYGQANFYSNNFNDFASSLTTLFELLIVNNWFVTMEGAVTVTTKWSRIYFISFYVVGVVMVLSLVVAFVVEAYFEDAAKLDAISRYTETKVPGETSIILDATISNSHEPSASRERTERLLRTRPPTLRMRPRADSIYVEEFL